MKLYDIRGKKNKTVLLGTAIDEPKKVDEREKRQENDKKLLRRQKDGGDDRKNGTMRPETFVKKDPL